MKIEICKAVPMTSNEPVENAEIQINKNIPKFNNIDEAKKFYQEEADVNSDGIINIVDAQLIAQGYVT